MIPSQLVARAREALDRKFAGNLVYPREVDAPDYVAPTGQQLQPGAFYEATVNEHRRPVLRRIGLSEAHTGWGRGERSHVVELRRELRHRNREYGRQSEEIGRLRAELDALRFRSGENSLVGKLYELRKALGLNRAASFQRVVQHAIEAVHELARREGADG